MTSTIFIGSDHAGFSLKCELINFLSNNYNGVLYDVGCHDEQPVDYPDISENVCENIKLNPNAFGILICGTGQGMAMSANRYNIIRAGVAWNAEIAKMMREHNNANVLCLPARYLSFDEAKEILNTFLTTSFTNEERHLRRINLF